MLIRVVLATTISALAIPAVAQEALPYEIDNFFRQRPSAESAPVSILPDPPLPDAGASSVPQPRPPNALPSPQIAYDLGDLLFDRVPDHFALAYRLEGLNDYTPQYRDGRDIAPLRYDIENLLNSTYAGLPTGESIGRAGSP